MIRYALEQLDIKHTFGIPMLVISGGVRSDSTYGYQLHDMDQHKMLEPITKANFKVEVHEQVVPTLFEAYRLANDGEPGPVFVEVPVNIQLYKDEVGEVRGKGQREDKFPLPQDVGDAILAYIEKARPAVAIKQVFLCLNAPYRPFTNSSTIASIVDTALTRAKISDPPSRSAHLLRHTVATSLLRSGVSLETVFSILRHRSFDEWHLVKP